MHGEDNTPDREDEDQSPVHCGTGRTRLFVGADLAAGAEIVLNADQSHHLCVVLRAKVGEPVLLFNGRDGEWQGMIETAHKKAARIVLKKQTRPQNEGADIWLLFAPVKRARIDFMVEKATEMGASHLAPVLTERTNVGRVNLARLEATAREAAEQCGLLGMPSLAEPVSLARLLTDWGTLAGDRTLIFCDEWAPPGSTPGALEALRAELGATPRLALLVGPEGGFSPAERERLMRLGFVRGISIGPRILRAETAVVAGLTALQMMLGDWRLPAS